MNDSALVTPDARMPGDSGTLWGVPPGANDSACASKADAGERGICTPPTGLNLPALTDARIIERRQSKRSRFFVAIGKGRIRPYQVRVVHDDGTSHLASLHATYEQADAAIAKIQESFRLIREAYAGMLAAEELI